MAAHSHIVAKAVLLLVLFVFIVCQLQLSNIYSGHATAAITAAAPARGLVVEHSAKLPRRPQQQLLHGRNGTLAADMRQRRRPQPPLTGPQQVVDACYSFLESHECIGTRWGLPFHFYKPSTQKYGAHQWLWDSGAHMVVWSHRNVSNAITDLRTMLQMQKPNGMIPEMIFWGADDAPWWRRKLETFWYSNPKTTDITQMPNLPFSLRAIYAATNDTALLRELVPPLVRYLDWWADSRDLDGNGLVAIMHGWESGIDASPAYDIAYGITDPSVSYFNLYPRLLKLLLSYKYTYGWDVGAILARRSAPFAAIDNWFVVMDVGVNSVYAAGWGVLAELAGHFDPELAKHCAARAAVAEAAILRHCWSESLGRFVSLYKDRRGVTRPAEVEVAQSLFPLLLPSLPRERAESIVRTQLTNPDKFWLQYPIPSASKDAKQYRPGESKLLWRGPTWPILNWFVMEGLQRHGYSAEQEQLMDRWLQLYESRGVYEQYNPETGDAFGAVGLGMSTLIVDWLYRMGRMGARAPPA